jgi:ATP-dependent Zn protease
VLSQSSGQSKIPYFDKSGEVFAERFVQKEAENIRNIFTLRILGLCESKSAAECVNGSSLPRLREQFGFFP